MTYFIKEQIATYEKSAAQFRLSDQGADYLAALRAIDQAEEALRSCRRYGSGYNYRFDELAVEKALAAIDNLGMVEQ